jgi:hypothetical protein
MHIVFFKKSNKGMLLSTILVAILLFPLTGSVPTKLTEATMITDYANPETHGIQQTASSSIGLNTNNDTTMYKNATETLNQANNSTMWMKTRQNNAISFRLPDGNQTVSSSNITATANVISSSNAVAQSPSKVSADFNGDGFGDKAIGVPGEDIGIVKDAGAVNVIYGSPSGLSAAALITDQLWTQNSTGIEGVAEGDDVFGRILSSGDYNGDGKSDLALGVPDEDINGPSVGAVNVIYGSIDGLSTTAVLPAQFWTQNSTSIQGIAETEDNFGSSVSSGDYNGDGKDDLAIGVPQEDVDLTVATLENFDNSATSGFVAADTGVVQVIYGSNLSGLSASSALPDQVLRQGFANIEDLSEDSDFFGYSN